MTQHSNPRKTGWELSYLQKPWKEKVNNHYCSLLEPWSFFKPDAFFSVRVCFLQRVRRAFPKANVALFGRKCEDERAKYTQRACISLVYLSLAKTPSLPIQLITLCMLPTTHLPNSFGSIVFEAIWFQGFNLLACWHFAWIWNKSAAVVTYGVRHTISSFHLHDRPK